MTYVEYKCSLKTARKRLLMTAFMGALLYFIPVVSAQNTTTEPIVGDASVTAFTPGTQAMNETTTGHVVSSAVDCVLTVPEEDINKTISDLHDAFKVSQASLIYFKLDFIGLANGVYGSRSAAITPSTWVWAIEGRGELLLTYPFDFQELSLGTLSRGVVDIEVPVMLPSDGCFQQARDADKQRILAKFTSGLVQSANRTLKFSSMDLYSDKRAFVCLERQLGPNEINLVGIYGIPLCTYYVVQGSTVHRCWPVDEDPFETDAFRIEKHGWLGAIFAVGLILAIFSPLAAGFFVRNNPPIVLQPNSKKQYLALNSDLPLGLKYFLFFSCEDCKAVVAVRWFLYVVGFMLVPFIPFMVSYNYQDSLIDRFDSVFDLLLVRSVVIFWFVAVNLVFLCIALCFMCLYLIDGDWVSRTLEVNDNDWDEFGFIVEMDSNRLQLPRRTGAKFSVFMYTMLQRTRMAVNPDVWGFWFGFAWEKIHGLCGGKWSEEGCKNCCQLSLSVSLYAIAFPFLFVSFCFLLLFNSVPLFYVVIWLVYKSLSKRLKAGEIVIAIMIALLWFAVLFVFVAAFVYVAELLGYTFIGFVLNSEYAGPIVVAFLTVVGYLTKAVTDFYDSYCSLLKRLIGAAEKVDEEMEKAGRHSTSHPTPTVTTGMVVQELIKYKDKVPVISRNLFQLVVRKYQPMYLAITGICIEFIVIIILVAFGLQTIFFIDSIEDLPAVIEFFATVVVAGVVPAVVLILKSPAKQLNDDEAKEYQLKADLEYYAEHSKFETMTVS